MESDKPTIEEQITAVLIDIEQKGFSAIQPFSIGDVELRMKHPNYKMKVNREQVKLVNFITATRRIDKKEFNGKRYVKIENAHPSIE